MQDFLPVFAAGNEGFHGSNAEDGLKTVTSPATAKNCISAGATNTAYQMDTQATSSQYIVFQMSIFQQQSSGSQDVDQYKASCCSKLCLACDWQRLRTLKIVCEWCCRTQVKLMCEAQSSPEC